MSDIFLVYFQINVQIFPELLGQTLERAMTRHNVSVGFEGAGIYPFDCEKPFEKNNLQRYVGVKGTKTIDEVLEKLKPADFQEENETTPRHVTRQLPVLCTDPKAKSFLVTVDSDKKKHWQKLSPRQLIQIPLTEEQAEVRDFPHFPQSVPVVIPDAVLRCSCSCLAQTKKYAPRQTFSLKHVFSFTGTKCFEESCTRETR